MTEEEKIAQMNAALANLADRFNPERMFREGTPSSRVFISYCGEDSAIAARLSGNNLAYPPFSKVVRYDMLPVLSLPASTTLVDLNRHGAASDYFGPLIFHKVWCQLVPVIPSFHGI